MIAIPDSARAVLEGPHLAHVVTIDPDGAPQVSCVWVGVDGDEVVFASLGPWRKLRNLSRDPRIALPIEADQLNDAGMPQYSSEERRVGNGWVCTCNYRGAPAH